MDLPIELDDYIRETIDDSLGLPVSTNTLQLKLRAAEDARRRLLDQYHLLLKKLKQKDDLIGRAKAEVSMNAVALKKFVEENGRLAEECASWVSQCNKWERECLLYDNDREVLMDFGNEAAERAEVAEIRVHELEGELGKLSGDLEFYKTEYEKQEVDSSAIRTDLEGNLLESILATLISKDENESGHTFLEANSENDSCLKLFKMWNSLRPSTQKVLSLAAKVRTLQHDKEHLRINLARAEEEVKLLFEENNILNAENKKLLRERHGEKNLDESGGKHTSSSSAKSNKRKSSAKMTSPVERKIYFKDPDSVRQPLSPLRHNSPDSRMHKK